LDLILILLISIKINLWYFWLLIIFWPYQMFKLIKIIKNKRINKKKGKFFRFNSNLNKCRKRNKSKNKLKK